VPVMPFTHRTGLPCRCRFIWPVPYERGNRACGSAGPTIRRLPARTQSAPGPVNSPVPNMCGPFVQKTRRPRRNPGWLFETVNSVAELAPARYKPRPRTEYPGGVRYTEDKPPSALLDLFRWVAGAALGQDPSLRSRNASTAQRDRFCETQQDPFRERRAFERRPAFVPGPMRFTNAQNLAAQIGALRGWRRAAGHGSRLIAGAVGTLANPGRRPASAQLSHDR